MGIEVFTRRLTDDAVEVRVCGEVRRVPRRLWALMAGPAPPVDFESNGCGPALDRAPAWVGRWLRWAIPDVLHGWPIWLACHWHDYHYSEARPLGGTWSSRRRADFLLARNVATVISEADVLSAPRVFAVATLYWLGVRIGGWSAFAYSNGSVIRTRNARWREALGLFFDA